MTRARAAVAVGVGLVLTAVGGGLGIPYARKVGWSLTTVVGLGVMVLGLALAAVGGIALVRSVRRFARVGMLLAIVAAAYLVVPSIGVAVAATHAPRPALGDATPADVGLAAADVRFVATDGVRLAGWYVPSRNGDAVVLLHPAGATRTSLLDHARVLAELGYGVLLYDARGHGESEGRAMEIGWYGDLDVAGAVRFVESQPDVTEGRIFAVGVSMGGEEALGALPEVARLCGVVAEGATARTAADASWMSDAYGVRGFLREGRDRLTYGLTDVLTPASPPRSLRSAAAAAAPRHVLLIAARRVGDEPRAAAHIARAAPATVSIWVAPGAAHGEALAARRGEWITRVREFLASAPC